MHQGGVDVCRRTGCFWISRRGSSARYSEHCICSSLYVANLRHLLERVFPCSMGHAVVVCLDMCCVDVRFRCVFGGPERSVAPQFCGNSPPRFLSWRGPPASRRQQPPSPAKPHRTASHATSAPDSSQAIFEHQDRGRKTPVCSHQHRRQTFYHAQSKQNERHRTPNPP